MRALFLALIALTTIQPVLADQKGEHAARKWRERHANQTLVEISSPTIAACVLQETRGSVDPSPDGRIGEIQDEMIEAVYGAYVQCKDDAAKERDHKRRKQRSLQDHPDWSRHLAQPLHPLKRPRSPCVGRFLLLLFDRKISSAEVAQW